jgi:hypothetical protein
MLKTQKKISFNIICLKTPKIAPLIGNKLIALFVQAYKPPALCGPQLEVVVTSVDMTVAELGPLLLALVRVSIVHIQFAVLNDNFASKYWILTKN